MDDKRIAGIVINDDVLATDYIQAIKDRKRKENLHRKQKQYKRRERFAMIMLFTFFGLMAFVMLLGLCRFAEIIGGMI